MTDQSVPLRKSVSYWARVVSVAGRVRRLWRSVLTEVWCRRWLVGQLTLLFLCLYAVWPVAVFDPDSTNLAQQLQWWLRLVVETMLVTLVGITVLKVVQSPTAEMSLGTALVWTVRCILPLALTAGIFFGLLLSSALLLVVPALVLAGYMLFTFVVAVNEDVWGVRAIVRSVELVRGTWWRTVAQVSGVMAIVIALAMLPLVALASLLHYATLVRVTELETVLVLAILLLSAVFEALYTVIWAVLLTTLYRRRCETAVPFEEGNYVRLLQLVRTAALLGWLLPLLAMVVGVGVIVQTPGLLDRILLYLATGI